MLEALGAEVLLAPTVQILPLEDFGPLDDAIRRIGSFDWLVFTSGNGVRHFLDRLEAVERDLRALGHLKLAAIGPATAKALGQFRLKADLVPESYRSEALAEALANRAAGRRILLARADRGRAVLRDELERVAQVEQVPVYRNIDAETLPRGVLERIEAGSVDWITLTSSAIAERLSDLLPAPTRERIGSEIRLASLSPVTSATIAPAGLAGGGRGDGLHLGRIGRGDFLEIGRRGRGQGRDLTSSSVWPIRLRSSVNSPEGLAG